MACPFTASPPRGVVTETFCLLLANLRERKKSRSDKFIGAYALSSSVMYGGKKINNGVLRQLPLNWCRAAGAACDV